MTLFDKILDKFDHVYLLTCAERNDRHYGIITQLKLLGYNDNNVNHLQKFSIIYTTVWPYNNVCANGINTLFQYQCFTKANEYDCTRNHYNIIKQSLCLGYKKILVMEDDICFLKPRRLNDFITNMPDDYSMIQMSGFTADERIIPILKNAIDNGEFYVPVKNNIWCTALYAVSTEGMQHYIDFIDKRCTVADMPLYIHPETGYYLSAWPIAIQADKSVIPSDIRNEENDTIDYKNSNKYEWVPKTLYNDYPMI